MKLLFERTEYLARIARTKQAMAERGIDLLLVASPANQFWLTGYDGWSFYTPQMVALRLDQEEPICVGSDDYYYTAKWDATLRAGLPNARFVDAFLLVNRCRMKKSAAELVFMRQAGQIAALAQKAAFDAAAPGVRQCDVMAELYKVTTAGTPEFGGTFPCKPPNAMVNEIASAPHLSWSDEKLKAGDLFYIEMGGVRHRYHSPLSRCLYLGKPTERMDSTAKVIAEGLAAVLDKVKPGVLCEELAATWTEVIARHGIEKDSRIGYPVGIGYPPTWGELTASLRAGDRTVMEEGMTFHCIPALWLDTWGLVISESFAVTAS